MEGGRSCASRQELAFAQIHTGEVPDGLLQQQDKHRRIQLLEGGPAVQEGVQLLPDPDLHPVLYVGDRVLGVVLARPVGGPCPSVPRSHHAADHGYADLGHQRLLASRLLHQSHRRMDRCVFDIRIRSAVRVRSCELRISIGHAQRQHTEAATRVRDGACQHPARRGSGSAGGRGRHLRYAPGEAARRLPNVREDALPGPHAAT